MIGYMSVLINPFFHSRCEKISVKNIIQRIFAMNFGRVHQMLSRSQHFFHVKSICRCGKLGLGLSENRKTEFDYFFLHFSRPWLSLCLPDNLDWFYICYNFNRGRTDTQIQRQVHIKGNNLHHPYLETRPSIQ